MPSTKNPNLSIQIFILVNHESCIYSLHYTKTFQPTRKIVKTYLLNIDVNERRDFRTSNKISLPTKMKMKMKTTPNVCVTSRNMNT